MPSIEDYTEIEKLGNGAFGIFFNYNQVMYFQFQN